MMNRAINMLHLESTDVCQAACPLCARETDLDFQKDQQHHLTVDMIKNSFETKWCAELDKLLICGNYGDPAAGRYTLEIYRYFRHLNPNIILGMHSNGGLQNTQWWHQLGQMFSGINDYVVFSIDGLEDTNHIYRKNVNWNKLMENIRAYISTGASAHWDMLVYQHNEHQVDLCQQLAKDLGFRWFRAKVSKRPLVSGLDRPVSWKLPQKSTVEISCHALKEQSIYMDSQGRISPCCWLGSRQKDFVTDFDQIQHTWSTDPNPICADACGTQNKTTNFDRQWQRNIEFS